MSREDAITKGRRYLGEGRLTLVSVTPTETLALCRGDGQTYHLTARRGRWTCTCDARTRCSHLLALGLVVVIA